MSLIDSIWYVIRTLQGLALACIKLGPETGICIIVIMLQEYTSVVHQFL